MADRNPLESRVRVLESTVNLLQSRLKAHRAHCDKSLRRMKVENDVMIRVILSMKKSVETERSWDTLRKNIRTLARVVLNEKPRS